MCIIRVISIMTVAQELITEAVDPEQRQGGRRMIIPLIHIDTYEDRLLCNAPKNHDGH